MKFDTLLGGADCQYASGLRMQPKAISGCAGDSRCGSAGVLGRRALRSSRRAQALVSSSDRRVASSLQTILFHIDASSHVILTLTLCVFLARLSLVHLSLRGPFLVFLSVVVHVSVSLGHNAGFLRNM